VKGFTLVESLVALSILGIALAAMMPGFLTQTDVNTLNEERWGAVEAAQQVMEELRQVNPGSLPTSGSAATQVVTVGNRDYEVVVSYCRRNEYCGSDSRHLAAEVQFGGRVIYTVETVYTRLR